MAISEMLTTRCSEVWWGELNETLVVGYYGLEEFTLLFWGFMHINFGLRISYNALRGVWKIPQVKESIRIAQYFYGRVFVV